MQEAERDINDLMEGKKGDLSDLSTKQQKSKALKLAERLERALRHQVSYYLSSKHANSSLVNFSKFFLV